MPTREVFVSYSQPDREAALALVAHLEEHGIQCWVAPRDVAPAADWAAEIIEAIAAARVMVLVFSGAANSSPQVRREVERAVHRGLTVLPFRLEDVLPSSSLEYFLSSQHWLDAFPGPMEPHYARLHARVRGILGIAAPAPPPAAAAAQAPVAPSAGARAAAPAEPLQLDAAQLHRIELALAAHIGPVARHLVHRAAANAYGAEAFIEQLSAEIDSETERRQFLGACRAILLSSI
jgi:hypothetical protein